MGSLSPKMWILVAKLHSFLASGRFSVWKADCTELRQFSSERVPNAQSPRVTG
jgi:hypothetical protein